MRLCVELFPTQIVQLDLGPSALHALPCRMARTKGNAEHGVREKRAIAFKNTVHWRGCRGTIDNRRNC